MKIGYLNWDTSSMPAFARMMHWRWTGALGVGREEGTGAGEVSRAKRKPSRDGLVQPHLRQ